MKHNPDNIRIDSLKAEGLHIVDKRGIKFDDVHERNMIWEGEKLVEWYADYLRDLDVDWPNWPHSYHQAVRDFRQAIFA